MTVTITPASGAGVLFTQSGVGSSPGYSAMDVRRSEIAGPVQEGVVAAGDWMVTQRAAGLAMFVDIAAGSGAFACVQGDSVTGQGLYTVAPHSTFITEAIATADATNPRVDQIILEVQDNVHDASGGNLARTRVLTGTPQAGTTLNSRAGVAALPGSALLLADVLVGAAVTTIPNTVIRDRRKWARGARFHRAITAGAVGATTTSLVGVDAEFRLECSGVPLRMTFSYGWSGTPIGTRGKVAMLMDDVDAAGYSRGYVTVTGVDEQMTWQVAFAPAAGSHRFQTGVALDAGTGTFTLSAASTEPRIIQVEEIVRQNSQNNATTSG